MKSRLTLTKAEKRQKTTEKIKQSPKGATLAGQIKKMDTVRKYKGKRK